MPVQQGPVKGHQARTVRPKQGAFDGAIRIDIRQSRPVGGHLPEVEAGHLAGIFGWRSIGFVIDNQYFFAADQQPIQLGRYNLAGNFSHQRYFGAGTRSEQRFEFRMFQDR